MPEVPCATLSLPPPGYSLDLASRPFLFLYIFRILTIVSFQSLIARSRGKSRFLREQKETWDHLVEEVQLRGEVIAQLIVAQQRVVELTPLAEEAANLRSRMVETHRDANEAEKVFEALSARSWKENEEATRVSNEWDELLQKDYEAHPSGSLTFWARLGRKGI